MISTGEKSSSGKPRQRARAAARSQARLMAVQALYQMDIAQTDLNDIIAEFSTARLEDRDDGPTLSPSGADDAIPPDTGSTPFDAIFFEDLAKGVVARQREIDPRIQHHLAQGWRLSRIDSTLRAILRAGAYEIVGRADVPVRVVISEYLDIAHAFFDSDEPRVVNAVLDHLGRQIRPAEFANSIEA